MIISLITGVQSLSIKSSAESVDDMDYENREALSSFAVEIAQKSKNITSINLEKNYFTAE